MMTFNKKNTVEEQIKELRNNYFDFWIKLIFIFIFIGLFVLLLNHTVVKYYNTDDSSTLVIIIVLIIFIINSFYLYIQYKKDYQDFIKNNKKQ